MSILMTTQSPMLASCPSPSLARPSSQFMAAILDYADPEVAKGIVDPYPYEQFIDYFGQYYDGY